MIYWIVTNGSIVTSLEFEMVVSTLDLDYSGLGDEIVLSALLRESSSKSSFAMLKD